MSSVVTGGAKPQGQTTFCSVVHKLKIPVWRGVPADVRGVITLKRLGIDGTTTLVLLNHYTCHRKVYYP